MDTPKPPQKPSHLLDDLESIREFLSNNEPAGIDTTDQYLDLPLLTDSVELGQIPLLSEIVAPATPTPPAQARPTITAAPAHTPPPAVPRPDPSPAAVTPAGQAPTIASAPAAIAQPAAATRPQPPQGLAQTVQRSVESSNTTSDLLRLDGELRAAAQLILQDVIDDFVPQIEAELKRRLEARLTRLLPPRKS
ncbi:DNA polymerase III subunit chi [Pseudomonas turukhanskensis]|uniref:DNA polymerase III subunit chi n=1 Tax=Pseudomonas turukhanskensis TaxID=1806536 RepID=A0A9W6NEN0_9PSED|nr:DNA polymerase III subunit chi [Pseudomonas turukhanskensis]GLK87880.1 hypothetical protein GCM10017655_09420 [Pseudomonas turukhanskensis]